ncbi:MAG: Hpt domain-containing protein [Gammaproteobacteria bacterium]|nr:Hpt domain-containing protein [Gammaproteobacteria bacterium]
MAGNEALYISLLKQFAQKHGDDLELLIQALEAGDEAQARQLLHTLKGVAGSISLDDLYDAICTFDECIDADKIAAMQKQMRIAKSSIGQL